MACYAGKGQHQQIDVRCRFSHEYDASVQQKGQTSADLLQLFSSNGTMLPMPTWAPLTSSHTATGRSGGHVSSAQMATCTAGQQLST